MPDLPPDDPYGIAALSNAKKLSDQAAILAAQYRLFIEPDQVVELRALDVGLDTGRTHTEAGFFDGHHLREMAAAALEVTRRARGVYFTINPLKPDLLARRANRMGWAKGGELAKDPDVIVRRFLLVDADPVRDPHVSATDDEKKFARDTVRAVREHLRARGWTEPILADSGNGFHLLYRVDLPADDGGTVKRVLQTLAAKFDTEHVRVDQSVFNPGRICKLPGTLSRKGDQVPGRPHRRARLLEVPTA